VLANGPFGAPLECGANLVVERSQNCSVKLTDKGTDAANWGGMRIAGHRSMDRIGYCRRSSASSGFSCRA
jgi:hypothetical protein